MTDLNINLTGDSKDSKDRVKKAQTRKKDAEFEPTWEEVWDTGYTRPTGTFKKGIYQLSNTDPDIKKLEEVRRAIEDGSLPTGVENLSKFSKAHALRLYNDLKEIKRKQVAKDMVENKPDNYYTITDVEDLLDLVDELTVEDEIALDTETTGVEWEDVTVGMSITLPKADKHVYIPYGHKNTKQIKRETVHATLQPALEREGLDIIAFNAKFDVHMLAKDGIDIRDNLWADPMIMMHVLNENEPTYSLKNLANKYGKYFGYEDDSLAFDELFSKDPQDFIKADIELASIYACKDTHLTYLLYKWQDEQLQKQPRLYSVYYDIERPITHVAIEMERNGLLMDLDYAEEYGKELSGRIKELSDIMESNWGDINTNSPKQLAEKLFDDLGYKDISGKRSTNAKVLKELAKEHHDVDALLEYRDITKLYGTYVESLPKAIRKDIPEYGIKGDGRLHGEFFQTGTVTGRFSSRDPNLQNQPDEARRLFVPEEGHVIVGIDLSSIEPRVLAHMSGDKLYQEPFLTGNDIYCQIASNTFNIPYEHTLEADDTYWREHTDLPSHPRDLGKLINLATSYGISAYALSDTLQTTPEEAQAFIDDFHKAFPQVSHWMNQQVAQADELGYVETLFGRKRRFLGHQHVAKQYHAVVNRIKQFTGGELPSNVWKAEIPYKLKQQYWNVNGTYGRVERQSVNAVVQGSAADLLKLAMVEIYKHLRDNKPEWKFLATIHDEILLEIPEDFTEDEIEVIEKLMTETTTLDVPIEVDTEIYAERWGEAVTKEEWFSK